MINHIYQLKPNIPGALLVLERLGEDEDNEEEEFPRGIILLLLGEELTKLSLIGLDIELLDVLIINRIHFLK